MLNYKDRRGGGRAVQPLRKANVDAKGKPEIAETMEDQFARIDAEAVLAKKKVRTTQAREFVHQALWDRKDLGNRLAEWSRWRDLPRAELISDAWIEWLCATATALASMLATVLRARELLEVPASRVARHDLRWAAYSFLRLAHKNPPADLSYANSTPLPPPVD